MLPNGYPRDGIFNPHLTTIKDSYITMNIKIKKIRTPQKIAVIILKFEQCGLQRVICPNDADRMAISVDPDTKHRKMLILVSFCINTI